MELKSLRQSHNYTQEYIANQLGITRAAYTNIENEKRQLDPASIITLANLYNVSADVILGRESFVEAKTPTANGDGLDEALVNLLVDLSPAEVQRVVDFVAGLIAAREDGASRQE